MTPGVTTTENGNVRLIRAGNIVDLTPDEATELAEELNDAVRVLARSRLEDLREAVSGDELAARIGRDVTEHDQATSAEAVSGA